MKQNAYTISKIAAQLFGIFSSGYVISILLFNIFAPTQRIPNGRWSMLYLGDKLSIQFSAESFKRDGEIISVWLREDRLQNFSTRGLKGTTMFSHLTINCSNNTVKFNEQLAFDSNLQLIKANKTVSEFQKPEDLMEMISTIIICQVLLVEDAVDKPDRLTI